MTASPSPEAPTGPSRGSNDGSAAEPRRAGARRLDAAVLALVALHLSITVPLARVLNVWTDEAYSLHTTSGGLGQALRRAASFELQAPGYFVALAAWRSIDPSPFFARLLSVLLAAAALVVLARLARFLLPARSAAVLVAAAALNPFLVWAAVEVRAYAMIVLLSAVVMLLFAEGLLAPRPRPWSVVAYAAASVALVYTQYYGALLLTANAAALVGARRWRALRTDLLAMAAVVVVVSPLAFSLPQAPQTGDGGDLAGRAVNAAGQMLYRLEEYLLPVVTLLGEGQPTAGGRSTALELAFKIAFVAAFMAVLFGSSAVRAFLRTDRGAWLLVSTATLAAQFGVLTAWVGPLYVDTRHTAALFIPALVFAAALFAAVPNRLVLAGWLAVSLGASLPRLVADYAPLAKPGDLARVARFIAAREQPGEPVFVFPCENVLGLRFHYAGRNALVPIPREPSLVEYDPRTFAVASAADVERRFATVPRARGHAWLVLEPSRSHMGVPNGREIVQAYLEARCAVEEEEAFARGTRVLYLSGC